MSDQPKIPVIIAGPRGNPFSFQRVMHFLPNVGDYIQVGVKKKAYTVMGITHTLTDNTHFATIHVR